MYIKINDRDVVPSNLAESVLERPVRSIHFELNDSFTFSDAFDAMCTMGVALNEIQIGSKEVENTEEDSIQLELDLVPTSEENQPEDEELESSSNEGEVSEEETKNS